MDHIIQRIEQLISWIDLGPANSDIAQAISLNIPLKTFREVLERSRASIINTPELFQEQNAIFSWYILDNMPFFETTDFGRTLHMVTNDLYFMSHLFGALRSAYAFQQENDHPCLQQVISYLEQIRSMIGESWSVAEADIASLCDAFRYFVSEHARDLYRQLGDDFRHILVSTPTIDNRGLPRMYRP